MVERILWTVMEKWLKDKISDEFTRCFEVIAKLCRLMQREDQKFDQFFEIYEALEIELLKKLPKLFRSYFLLDKLRFTLR